MKLDRYVIREAFGPLLIGIVLIAMLFLANDLIAVLKSLNIDQIPPLAIAQLVLLKLPYWLSFTIPVGVTLGVSLALARLTRENEITAVRAAGTPIRRVLLPVAFLGFVASASSWYVVEEVMPWSAQKYRDVQAEVGALGQQPEFTSNAMMKLDRYTVSIGTTLKQTDGSIMLRDVFAVERPEPGKTWIYDAKEGYYNNGIWEFPSPVIWIIDGENFQVIESTEPLRINEPIRIADLFGVPNADEMTAKNLKDAIDAGRRRGDPSVRLLEVEYYFKYSLPVSCLVFALTGAIMSIRLARTGAFAGVLVSFVLVLLYYNIFVIAKDVIGRNGWMTPIMAAWLPNALFLVVGLLGMRRIE